MEDLNYSKYSFCMSTVSQEEDNSVPIVEAVKAVEAVVVDQGNVLYE